MDDVEELELSRAVSVTTTDFIRASIRERIETKGFSGPPVEIVQFHVFIHCTNGSGRHMVDFEDHHVEPGTVFWIRPGQAQRWSSIGGGFDADVAVFSSASIPDLPLFDHLLGSTAMANVGDDSDRLRQQMSWMATDLETTGDHTMAAAVVGVILRLFARHARSDDPAIDTPHGRLVAAFINSVDRNVDQRSVTWHAREIGVSTRSIARATTEILGQPPKELIDSRVVLEARRRLAWSDDDVATIARALAFSEPSNFTKFFRTRTGTSPSGFRASVTEMAAAATSDEGSPVSGG